MITIHHLGVSQSDRIVWLLEELRLAYRLSSACLAGAEFTCADIMVMFPWPAYLKAMSIAGPSATPGDRNEP